MMPKDISWHSSPAEHRACVALTTSKNSCFNSATIGRGKHTLHRDSTASTTTNKNIHTRKVMKGS